MSKIVKIAAMVAVATALIVFAAPLAAGFGALGATSVTAAGISAAGLGLAISTALSVGMGLFIKKPDLSSAMADRLNASVNPTAPRKIVFGRTAAGNDVRYFEKHDLPSTKKDGYSQVIALASHRINAVKGWYIEEELAWNGSAIIGEKKDGIRSFRPVLEGSSSNSFSLGDDGFWTTSAKFTGCAYAAVTYKMDPEIWESGLPAKSVFVVEGCPLYDPRRDSTNGGSGAHRITDQSTWKFFEGSTEIGRNPALALAVYLLGYRINGKLCWGMGVPANRIDWDNIREYANLCEERVLTAAGGDVQRYTCDGIVSTADTHESVITALTSAMGSCKLTDVGGQYTIIGGFDDTLAPTVDFTEDDLVGPVGSPSPYSWVPVPPSRETYNIARGRYSDPAALYQLADWGVIETDPLPDLVPRTMTLDFSMVSRSETCQRIAKQILVREAKTPGHFSATFGPKAFAAIVGSLVTLSLPQQGWNRKLFRVVEQADSHDLIFTLALREESSEVYGWDREEKPLPASIRPPGWNPGETISPIGLSVTSRTFVSSGGVEVSEIDAAWTPEFSGRVVGIQIESRPTGSAAWTEQASLHDAKTGLFTFMSNAPATSIEVRARFKMASGVYSPWSSQNVQSAPSSAFDAVARDNSANAVNLAGQANTNATQAVDAGVLLAQQLDARFDAADASITDLLASVAPLPGRILAAEGKVTTIESTVGGQGSSIISLQQTANTTAGQLASLTSRVSAGTSPNLARNPDFSNGMAEWGNNVAGWAVTPGGNGWGAYASTGVDPGNGGYSYLYQDIGIEANSPYTLAADMGQFVNGGLGFHYLQIEWLDSAGGTIGTGIVGNTRYSSVNFDPTGASRAFLHATGTPPGNAAKARIYLVWYKGSGSVQSFHCRQVKFERGAFPTPFSSEASVIQAFSAISTLDTQYASLSSTVATTGATVNQQAGAISNLNGRTAAFWQVEAVAGGRAQVRVFSDAVNGAGVDIVGDTRISGNLLVSGSVYGDRLVDLSLGTSKIAGNAVTIPVSAFAAHSDNTSNAWQTFLSAGIDAEGYPVQVTVTATINTTNSGSNGITYVRVLRDGGVEVYPQVNYGSNGGFKTFCVSITDNPGGGAHTYQLQIMGGTSAFARAINLLAVKR